VWDQRLLRLPLIGDLVSKLETARFTRTLETLLTNGVTLVGALDIAKEIIRNQCMAEKVSRLTVSVREGKGLTNALVEAKAFPKLAGELLQVGEETGNLEGMLGQLAEIYEREVKTAVQRLVALVEPLLILGLGLLIAGIILSLLVAILGVNELGV
jgi:general secretion pathway protein F